MNNTSRVSKLVGKLNPSHYVFPGLSRDAKIAIKCTVTEFNITNTPSPLNLIENIDRILSQVYGLQISEIRVNTRSSTNVLARQTGMLLLRLAGKSLPQTAAEYGKEHATAIHAIYKKCFPILITKTKPDEYNNLVAAIRAFHTLYPDYSLSPLPWGWDNPNTRIHKPQQGNRERNVAVPSV